MAGTKTNEAPGTRAVLRHHQMSAYKARQVLDLIRGQDVDRAEEILRSTPREAAHVVAKVLGSAVSNARNNDLLDPEELYVSACFADEGTTLKRWRPRARGRATRIRKRACHITVIVSRLPDDRLERRRADRADRSAAMRSRRVAASRRAGEAAPADAPGAGVPGETEETQEVTDEFAQGRKAVQTAEDAVETAEDAGAAEAEESAVHDDTEEDSAQDAEAVEPDESAVQDKEAGEHVQSTEESD